MLSSHRFLCLSLCLPHMLVYMARQTPKTRYSSSSQGHPLGSGYVRSSEHRSTIVPLPGSTALLASLEDLQHANATLDPAQHMPDTPGYRSDNNPYPPRVSEDFAQIDAGCLETAYHLLTYQVIVGCYGNCHIFIQLSLIYKVCQTYCILLYLPTTR